MPIDNLQQKINCQMNNYFKFFLKVLSVRNMYSIVSFSSLSIVIRWNFVITKTLKFLPQRFAQENSRASKGVYQKFATESSKCI